MLKKTLSILFITRLIIAVLIFAVVGVAATQAEKETRIMKGTIINKNIGLVTVGSKKQIGQILTLTAGPRTDLIAFHAGDQIIIEYSTDYIIQSITKQS